jgi:hypothetical protein
VRKLRSLAAEEPPPRNAMKFIVSFKRRTVMASQTDADIAALRSQITQLRTDFTKITGSMRGAASNGIADAAESVQLSTENALNEAKRHVQGIGREIEQRPIAASLFAFGSGILLGLFLKARRS